MLRLRTLVLIVLHLAALRVLSQAADETFETKNNKDIEFGISGINFRGYDFSKDFFGVRDRYVLSGSPGLAFLSGKNGKQVRLRAFYNEISASGELKGRLISIWSNPYNESIMQFYRQEVELRIGYLRTINSSKKSNTHLYFSGDLYYSFGRQKYALVYNQSGGFGEMIGYTYHSIGLLQTLGLKFALKANFTLYAETGFAIESVFGKRNYNDPSFRHYETNTTLGANLRVLQLSLTKKI
jgi:hypothetical protein